MNVFISVSPPPYLKGTNQFECSHVTLSIKTETEYENQKQKHKILIIIKLMYSFNVVALGWYAVKICVYSFCKSLLNVIWPTAKLCSCVYDDK